MESGNVSPLNPAEINRRENLIAFLLACMDIQFIRSPRFGRNVIAVESIPGFDDIEVHPGNFPRDTHGCCLVGCTEGADFVGQSDEEFDALMGKITPVGQIEYVDG